MSRKDTVIVRVALGDPLGDAMSRMRTWLDSEKIQPAGFTTAVCATGYTLTIGFGSSEEATRFRQQFGAATQPRIRNEAGKHPAAPLALADARW